MLLIAVLGCDQRGNLRQVTGTVTVDGTPLENGSIRFAPLDGEGPTAGTTIRDGRFQVEMPIGKKRVTIEAFRPGAVRRADSYPGMAGRESNVQFLPARYNSDSTLEADISANEKTVNFELQGK